MALAEVIVGGLKRENFVVSGLKLTKSFCRTWGIVVDNDVFRLSISRCVPETIAIEVWSCPKSHRILDVFCPPKF